MRMSSRMSSMGRMWNRLSRYILQKVQELLEQPTVAWSR